MYHPRALESHWLKASGQFPALMLTGARQVGKTTLLRRIAESERNYATLDDPGIRSLANDDPALFLQRYKSPVLIDEIQYAPGLLPVIKIMIDENRRPGQFWLAGSQQFHLMKGVSESLAGRVGLLNLFGFSARERDRRRVDLPPFLPLDSILIEREPSAATSDLSAVYQRVWSGGLPGLIAGPAQDPELFFSSYLQTYLQRDLRDLAQVGDEMAFLRFLRAAAARTARMLNLSDLARDADVSVNTAKNWLSILRASFQIELLEPYHSNLTKRLVKRPKLYFLDTGLCAYLTEWSSPETLEAGALSGPLLETYVFGEIFKSWRHRGKRPPMFYYRDKDGKEIDLLLVRDGMLHPVEIKKSASPRREWLRPIETLRGLGAKVGEGAVICLCRERMPLDRGVDSVPVGLI